VGEYAGFASDAFHNDQPIDATGFVYMRGGICVEPLVEWTEFTGDSKALDLARRFANCELGGHSTVTVPPGSKQIAEQVKRYVRFEPDGSFAGHVHTGISTLIGVVRLGRYYLKQGETETGGRYLRVARKSYDWLFTPACGSNRMGWVPQGSAVSETCSAADVMELAEVIASCANLSADFKDRSWLYDDLERMAVNVPAATQLRFTPEFDSFLAACYDVEDQKSLEIARKFNGTWSSSFDPNDLARGDGLFLTGCCQYAGVTALYAGWRNALQWSNNVLRVNYFLNRSLPQAEMTTGPGVPRFCKSRVTSLRCSCMASRALTGSRF